MRSKIVLLVRHVIKVIIRSQIKLKLMKKKRSFTEFDYARETTYLNGPLSYSYENIVLRLYHCPRTTFQNLILLIRIIFKITFL